MELIVKTFSELSVDELYEIYKLRVSVFVVEQNCPYQEADDYDRVSLHVYLKNETGICAYIRILPKNTVFDEVSIGRVIAVKRREGLGTRIVKEGIRIAHERFKTDVIMIEAQTYVKSLYEKLGFEQISDEFLEDGIPHIKMRYQRNK